MKRHFIAIFVLIVSMLIALATVILRYHYFSDVIVGMLNSTLVFYYLLILEELYF